MVTNDCTCYRYHRPISDGDGPACEIIMQRDMHEYCLQCRQVKYRYVTACPHCGWYDSAAEGIRTGTDRYWRAQSGSY